MFDPKKPLPLRSEIKVADIESKTIFKIVCPYCEYSWEIIDLGDSSDCSSPDPIDDLFQCPECSEWMGACEDEEMIDCFYENFDALED